MEYSNDPNDETSTDKEEDKEIVYTVDLVIDKYAGGETVTSYTYENSNGDTVTVYSEDGITYYTDTALTTKTTIPDGTTPTEGAEVDKTSTKLSGAEFVLVKKVTNEDGTTKELFYKYTAATETTSAKVEWVDSINDATRVTTDTNGAAKFEGLEAGTGDGATYYLRETKAPDGYNQLTSDKEVTIRRTEENNTVTISGDKVEVANESGTELPSTGGIGTTIFYVVGTVLVLGAAILLITKKRMSGEQ